MQHDRTRRTVGQASPPACTCGARTPHPITRELHRYDCRFLEASRARREQDLAVLAGRPDGWGYIRPVDPTEVAEVADAVGEPIPTGRHTRRRWSVEVRAEHDPDGTVRLLRTIRRDGRAVAAILDTAPAVAGAAR